MTGAVEEITMETIQSLRDRGLYFEADDQLEAFHKDVKKGKRQELNTINTKDRRIKKHFNVCTSLSCSNTVVKDRCMCEYHMARHRESDKRLRGKNAKANDSK